MDYFIGSMAAAALALFCAVASLAVNRIMRPGGTKEDDPADVLFHSAARLKNLPDSEDIYKAISEEMHKLCGNSHIVMVNSFDKKYDLLTIKAISGIGSLVQGEHS
ncbi:MAG: hypothetical protein AABZ57_02100 [Candidatus Margulisiibacteriota bacterium]